MQERVEGPPLDRERLWRPEREEPLAFSIAMQRLP